MAVITSDDVNVRTISITGISQAEMNQVVEAGILAVFGPDLPAGYELDADDEVEVFAPSGRIFARSNDYEYSIEVVETD